MWCTIVIAQFNLLPSVVFTCSWLSTNYGIIHLKWKSIFISRHYNQQTTELTWSRSGWNPSIPEVLVSSWPHFLWRTHHCIRKHRCTSGKVKWGGLGWKVVGEWRWQWDGPWTWWKWWQWCVFVSVNTLHTNKCMVSHILLFNKPWLKPGA